jgi:uncharacterized protein
MENAIRDALGGDARIAFAMLFGSAARGETTPHSDLDIAIGLEPATHLDARDLGEIVARLEHATGRTVDLVILNEAPPGVAYRAFRDGILLLERNRQLRVSLQSRVILEYLDFKPVEDLCSHAVLKAAADGR